MASFKRGRGDYTGGYAGIRKTTFSSGSRQAPVSMKITTGSADGTLNKLLHQLPQKIRHKPLVEGAKVIAKGARRSALFKDLTGTLRRSIRAVKERNFVVARANAPHAHLVEYGHEGPQPAGAKAFMRESAKQNTDAAYRAVVRGIESELAKLKL